MRRSARSVWVRCAPLLAALLLIYGVLAALVVFVWPGLFGFHTLIGLGSSMGDTIPSGSLLVTRSVAAEDVRVGDVISFRYEGLKHPITHRVVGIRSEAGSRIFVTQGDGNPAPDPFPVSGEQGIARVIYSAPRIGIALPLVGFLLLTAALAGIYVLWARRRRRRLTAGGGRR